MNGILESYYPTIKAAIYFARERWQEYKVEFDKLDTDGDGIVSVSCGDINPEDLVIKGKEKELSDFLNSLDYETVKVLQIIMYIGRDNSCAEDDGTYNYLETRKSFDKRGWNNDKWIEVNQMVEKVHLVDYLTEGCRKLGIIL